VSVKPGVNFTYILRAAFVPLFLRQKSSNLNFEMQKKIWAKNFYTKKLTEKCWWNWSLCSLKASKFIIILIGLHGRILWQGLPNRSFHQRQSVGDIPWKPGSYQFRIFSVKNENSSLPKRLKPNYCIYGVTIIVEFFDSFESNTVIFDWISN
jgi:hypothetical protein